MSFWSLKLMPYGKQPVTIRLRENETELSEPEAEQDSAGDRPGVYGDLTYRFKLTGDDVLRVQDVFVFVNDVRRWSVYDNGTIFFGNSGADGKLFLDCFGYAELELQVVLDDDTVISLFSGYLPVLVREGKFNKAAEKMVRYVYENREEFLFNGEIKSRSPADLKEKGHRTLEAVIILAEQIAGVYENSYGYFKANSRFHTKKVPAVEDLERLQTITPATLEYIVSHPEQLRQVNSSRGISLGNRMYQPRKTLTIQNVYSYDIYENRVLLDYLKTMIHSVGEMEYQCEKMLSCVPRKKIYDTEYVNSSFFITLQTGKMLEDGRKRCSALYKRLVRIYELYSGIYPFPGEYMSTPPKATPVFMMVPGYNRIFVSMHQWFHFGIYDFQKESFMLSLANISSLYESYLLIKLGKYFESRGYSLTEERRFQYPVPSKWKYKNTLISNTFIYSKEQERITLYYQPVIFDHDQSKLNGIGLYRNNSVLIHTEKGVQDPGEYYYTPDFIIKIEQGDMDRYLLLDAKFSGIANVKKYYVKDLAFKYLFSTSTVRDSDSIAGLCILYGKCEKGEQLQSIYNKCLRGQKILPIAELLPFMEESSVSQQYERLDMLFEKIRKI